MFPVSLSYPFHITYFLFNYLWLNKKPFKPFISIDLFAMDSLAVVYFYNWKKSI